MHRSETFRLAVAQGVVGVDPSGPEIRRSGARVRELMREAKNQGARMIQFAEGAISSYPDKHLMSATSPELGPADWTKVDWPVLEEELELTAALAGELGLWTVLGSIHRLTAPHRPYNSLYVISDTGELVHRYDKRLVSFSEISYLYTPGVTPLAFDVDGWRFGAAICIEINYPELFLEYERLGVDCALVSSFSEDPMFGVLAQGHAAGNSYWVSFSVPAQCSTAVPSGVVDPDGQWFAQGPADGSQAVVIAELDPAVSEPATVAVKYRRPWRQKVRSGIYNEHFVTDPRGQDRTRF